ncbi:hypothetical protein Xen7305DRAFT_00019190 [Xenococcus sp. PCC 7305]|uniref:hypothetical protein n=1 Tax=Xenococcus sp. PCC 7305 TaxID=102125 RepID=UPI0002AC4D47|nr:hypothetical protein [Xenococcus sp. PCC 7305]ELS02206.1 hypothetical protein Xen7305DRAFT_00019190 [Xenococcus sp. PCC 7305]
MNNPVIETDLAEVLGQINQKLDKIDDRLNKLEVGQAELKGDIKALDEKLSGQIKSVDEKLSGQIKSVDEKLSGQIKTLDTKVEQMDKRIANQEFIPIRGQVNRGVVVGLILVILGGAVKLFELGNF